MRRTLFTILLLAFSTNYALADCLWEDKKYSPGSFICVFDYAQLLSQPIIQSRDYDREGDQPVLTIIGKTLTCTADKWEEGDICLRTEMPSTEGNHWILDALNGLKLNQEPDLKIQAEE